MDSSISRFMPYIVDAVCVVILFLFMRGFAKKGLYNCLMPFIVIILSIAFAICGSNILTKPITDQLVFPRVEAKIVEKYEDALEQSAGEGAEIPDDFDMRSLDGLGSEELQAIKSQIEEYAGRYGLDLSGIDIDDLLKAPETGKPGSSGDTSASLKDRVLEGLLDKAYGVTSTIVHWVLMGVLVIIGLLVFNLIKKLVGLITHLPIIRFFNALGGVIIGAALFMVVIFIGSRALRAFGVDFLDRCAQGTVVLNYFMSL